jgi:hypothetical protein
MTAVAARILGLQPASPGVLVSQEELFHNFYNDHYADVPDAEKLFFSTQVRQRWMAWPPPTHFKDGFPGMADRMVAWEQYAVAMGRESAQTVLADTDPAVVGHEGTTALILAARHMAAEGNRILLTVLGLTSCLYAILDIKGDILDRPHLPSDAYMLAQLTGIPTVAWGILWITVALVVSAWLFLRAFRSA